MGGGAMGSVWVGLASSLAMVVDADKDTSYWPPGKANANVKRRMYWHDSHNILQDLAQFDKLYVQYHNCAYSPFGTPANAEENLAFESYWYLGLTQTYRANAAFSLYGILKGQRDRGCREATFINSFHTTFGAQTFVEAMQLLGYLDGNNDIFANNCFSSVCVRQLGDDDGQVNDATIPAMGETAFPNAISTTLGCNYYHRFELQQFGGATCDRRKYFQSYDLLDQQNALLEELQCVILYDRDTDYTNDGSTYQWMDDDFWDFDKNQGGYNRDEEDAAVVPYMKHPLDLLKYSHTCSLFLYPYSCPDPYGLVAKYLDKINRETQVVTYQDTDASAWKRTVCLVVMISLGTLMMGVSFGIDYALKRRKRSRKATNEVAKAASIESELQPSNLSATDTSHTDEKFSDEAESNYSLGTESILESFLGAAIVSRLRAIFTPPQDKYFDDGDDSLMNTEEMPRRKTPESKPRQPSRDSDFSVDSESIQDSIFGASVFSLLSAFFTPRQDKYFDDNDSLINTEKMPRRKTPESKTHQPPGEESDYSVDTENIPGPFSVAAIFSRLRGFFTIRQGRDFDDGDDSLMKNNKKESPRIVTSREDPETRAALEATSSHNDFLSPNSFHRINSAPATSDGAGFPPCTGDQVPMSLSLNKSNTSGLAGLPATEARVGTVPSVAEILPPAGSSVALARNTAPAGVILPPTSGSLVAVANNTAKRAETLTTELEEVEPTPSTHSQRTEDSEIPVIRPPSTRGFFRRIRSIRK